MVNIVSIQIKTGLQKSEKVIKLFLNLLFMIICFNCKTAAIILIFYVKFIVLYLKNELYHDLVDKMR